MSLFSFFFFFFQAEDGIRDHCVTGVQTCALPILQRRADLVPNLVETVKGYAKQEQTVFTEVAEARAKLAGAVQGGDLQQMAQANAALTAPLGRLLAIAESYPQLKSNENFRAL